jgi:hypothetical protein
MRAPTLIGTILTVSFSVAFAQTVKDAPPASGIGFRTVAEALESLKGTPSVQITTTKPDGWIIANDRSNDIQWSFTPLGHYAHPAVVKRAIKQSTDGNIYVEMTALCQAEKTPCDRLIEEFNHLNERIRQDIQRRSKGGR